MDGYCGTRRQDDKAMGGTAEQTGRFVNVVDDGRRRNFIENNGWSSDALLASLFLCQTLTNFHFAPVSRQGTTLFAGNHGRVADGWTW